MKKIILSTMALFLVTQAFAFNITDPFYMPKKEAFYLDSALVLENSGNLRAYGLQEKFVYGIMDNLSVSLGLGYAKVKHGDNGLQDPVIGARYRLQEEDKGTMTIDLLGYISPSIFDSPYNNEGGVAKGSTDFGFSVMGGSREYLANTMLWMEVGIDFIGSTKWSKSGNIIGIAANAKYYLDDYNSFSGGLFGKNYTGFNDNYTGFGIKLDYARMLQDNLALIPFWSAEKRSDDLPSEVIYGIMVRYTF